MKKKLRILLINDTLEPIGGAESYVETLNQLLLENGHDTRVLTGEGGVGLRDSFFSRWYSFKFYSATLKIIKNFKPNVAHVNGISRNLSPSVIKACFDSNIPVVQTVHDYHYICPKIWMLNDDLSEFTQHNSSLKCIFNHLPKRHVTYSIFQSLKTNFHKPYIHKYVDIFICPSKNMIEWYSKVFSDKKCIYLPNFVNENKFKYSEVKNFNQLLFVGRLSREKGVEILINAFARIYKDLPKVTLKIIGDGPEKKNLINLTRSRGLINRVKFADKTNNINLNLIYKESSAIVIPSLWVENCPMVAIEAISSGLPIIASKSGGLKDLIRDNENGLLFERNNEKDLSEAIMKLLTSNTKLRLYSINQKSHRLKYTKRAYLEQLEKIYIQVIK